MPADSGLASPLAFVRTMALVDTGCTTSIVDTVSVDPLRALPGGRPLQVQALNARSAHQGGAAQLMPTLGLEVDVGDATTSRTIPVGRMPMPSVLVEQGVRFVLGRDILEARFSTIQWTRTEVRLMAELPG